MFQVSDNDRTLIELLRTHAEMSIGQLENSLGVTATAVRQRLNRLMGMGLIKRKQSIEGRGRPVHLYILTEKGRQTHPNNLGDLGLVLWEEIQQISDEKTRQSILLGAVRRLAEKYEHEVHGSSVTERMEAIVQLFSQRQIPVALNRQGELPVIQISGCPYPILAEESREICDLEEKLLSKIVGQPIKLCECQQDGAAYCSFKTQAETQTTSSAMSSV